MNSGLGRLDLVCSCRECAGQKAVKSGRRGAQGKVRTPEILLGRCQAGTYRNMHTQDDLPGPPGAYLALARWGPSRPEFTKPRTFRVLWDQIDVPEARFCELGPGTHLLPNWPLCRGAYFLATSHRPKKWWWWVRRHWKITPSQAQKDASRKRSHMKEMNTAS